MEEEIEAVEQTIRSQSNIRKKGGAVKNLELIKKNKQKQLKKLMDGSKKDNVLKFEELGSDYLFVDEAHS